MRGVRIQWRAAGKGGAAILVAVLALVTGPKLLEAPAPPPLAADVGLPRRRPAATLPIAPVAGPAVGPGRAVTVGGVRRRSAAAARGGERRNGRPTSRPRKMAGRRPRPTGAAQAQPAPLPPPPVEIEAAPEPAPAATSPATVAPQPRRGPPEPAASARYDDGSVEFAPH